MKDSVKPMTRRTLPRPRHDERADVAAVARYPHQHALLTMPVVAQHPVEAVFQLRDSAKGSGGRARREIV